jgi:hypothetical protein
MKNRIFEEMMLRGWNLGENEIKDFEDVLNTHMDKMEYMLNTDYSDGEARIDLRNWTAYISQDEIKNIFEFMLDFMYSLENLDRKDKNKGLYF